MTWTYYWTPGAQPLYNQFQYNGYAVGCGPVAWSLLIGWADRRAAAGGYWGPRWGLYRQNGGTGADAVAPINPDTGVTNVIKEIHGDVGTFNLFGSGATFPWSMGGVQQYLNGRSGTSQSTHWNSFGISEGGLRDIAIIMIRDRGTPSIIGTGWLNHYPLAYGYAWQRRVIRRCFIFCWDEVVYDHCFYVNQGWGGSGNEWVPASTWFASEAYP